MFGYRSNVPKVRLTTDRLVVRLVHDRDAWRLADYYAENRRISLHRSQCATKKPLLSIQAGRRAGDD